MHLYFKTCASFVLYLLFFQSTVAQFKPRLVDTRTKICGNNKVCKECGRCTGADNVKNERCDTSLFAVSSYVTKGNPIYTADCEELDMCQPNPCGENSKSCTPLFGSWYCDCKDTFYSHNCSEINVAVKKNYYASHIYVMYPPYSRPFDKTKLMVIVRNPGNNLEIHVDYGLGFVAIQNEKSSVLAVPSKLCAQCDVVPFRLCTFLEKLESHSVYMFETTYPMILKQDVDEITETLARSIDHIGRKYKITVTVMNKMNIENWKPVQFIREYPKVILHDAFEGDECIPKVQLKGCTKDNNKITFTYANQRKQIESTVSVANSCTASMKRKWEIWKMDINFDEQDKPVKREVDKESIVFLPFDLTAGSKYLIKLYGIYNDEEKYLYNIDYCIHEVRYSPLEPRIKGGSTRHVFYNSEIILDASDSRDPNNKPDDQGHLRYSWKCGAIRPFCRTTNVTTSKHVIRGPFDIGVTYRFELTLYSVNGDRESKTVEQNIFITAEPVKNILILCKKNCGGTGQKASIYELIYLEAVIEEGSADDADDIDQSPLDFKWTYTGGGVMNEESVNNLIKEGTPSNVLVILRDKLKAESNYTFKVTILGNEGQASYTIETSPFPKEGTCSISPLEGTIGETIFTITCENFDTAQQDGFLSYELFVVKQNSSHRALYLGSKTEGKFEDIVLTEGLITIRIVDSIFMYREVNLTVQLNPREFSSTEMDDKLAEAKLLDKSGDKTGVIRKIAVMGSLLKYTKSKYFFGRVCLELLKKVDLLDMNTVKMMAGGLEYFLESITEETGLPSELISLSGNVLRNVGSSFKTLLTDKLKQSDWVEYRVMKQVSVAMIGSSELIMRKKNDSNLFKSPVMTTSMEELQLEYKEGFVSMMESLGMLAESVGHRLLPYEDRFKTNTTKVTVWAKLHETARAVSKMVVPMEMNKSSLSFSPTLADELLSKPGPVVVEVVDMVDNPYWWYTGLNNDIQSNILSLTLRKKKVNNTHPFKRLNNSIDIYMTLKNDIDVSPINGTAHRVKPDDDADTKDLAVSVHRIETPLNSKLLLDFTGISVPLKVLVLKDMIPDYEYMEELATSLTIENPTYHVNDMITESVSFFYIGVLPDNNVPKDKTEFNFSFKVVTLSCKIWRESIFTNKGCEVMHDSNSTLLHCKCTHLSIFGGAEIMAPNLINPVTDLKLFLTLKDNPTVFIVISTLLILYIVLLIWSQYKDNEARKQKAVVILDDNYPGEEFGYLITVYTGARIRAGTNANVGIRIYGSNKSSRAHILKSKDRPTMQRNNDDWFLLFTPVHLGEILNIHVWHDNIGGHSDWFCEKILVYDLETQEEYVFLIDQWMSPAENEYLEVYMSPVPRNVAHSRGKLTFENALLGFREMHVWGSILNRHPRSSETRAHRLAVCMCTIMVTMLTSIMYYDIFEAKEDEPYFSLNLREVQVAVQSAIIATPVVALVLYLFGKARKKKAAVKVVDAERHSSVVSKDHKSISSKKSISAHSVKNLSVEEEEEEKPGKLYLLYSKLVHKMIKTKPLNPVKIEFDHKSHKVERKGWLIAAWVVSQLIIFICGFFVIMYGLKLGKVRSELWLLSVAGGVGQDIFLSTPIKIIAVAFMLGFAYGRLFEVATYDLNIEQAMRKNLVGDKEYLKELGIRRAQPMYHPLSRAQVYAFRAQRIRYIHWGMFLEFLIILSFSISLIFLVTKTYSAKYYFQNLELKKALTLPLIKGNISVGFDDVLDIKSLKEFMRLSFLPKVYKVMWYNDELSSNFEGKFDTSGWFINEADRLIGVPRIRQLRVREDACILPDLIKKAGLNMKCTASLSEISEEKRNFKISWAVEDKDENPLPSPWAYVTMDKSGAISLRGYSGQVYHAGGYVVNLGRTLKESNFTLSEVLYSDWLNVFSRFIILEMTLYNVNTNAFSLAQLMMENLPGGIIIRRTQVLSLQVVKEWGAWTIVFVLFTMYFLFRNLYTLNQQGLIKYCTQFWNFFEVLILFMCLANLGIHIAHVYYSSSKIQEFQMSGKESFYSYTALIYYYHLIQIMLSALIVCATIRLLKTLKLGRNGLITFYTILFSTRCVFCITIVFVIFLLLQSIIIAHQCNTAFSNTWGMFFTYRTAYRNMIKHSVFSEKRLAVFIYCLSAAGFSLVFVVLYSYFFRIAKGHKMVKHEIFNYFTFFIDWLTTCWKKNERSGVVSTRLRGGMEMETLKTDLSEEHENLMLLKSIKYIKAHIGQIKNNKNNDLEADNSNICIKQSNKIVEYEGNPSLYFKFKTSNLDFMLTSVISKIDDILLNEI